MSNDNQTTATRQWQAYTAEMLGTGVLVFLGCGAVISNSMNSGAGIVGIAASFGLAVAMMVYAVGPISGGHINPAVTVTLAATGHFPRKQVLPYIGAQAAGAVLASLLHFAIYGGPVASVASYGATIPTISAAAALGFEAILTFILVFVVMSFATNPNAPGAVAALGIGAVVVADIIVAGSVTGASMNPARSFGPAVFAGGAAMSNLWIYVVGPVLGGVLAGFTYEALRERAVTGEQAVVVDDSSSRHAAAG